MLVGLLLVCAAIWANCAHDLTAAGCGTCTPDGQTCTGCTEPSKNIQIDKKSCDASCPPNSAANDQKVCVCNEGYTPVADQNQCKETPSAGCAHDLTAAGCGTCTPDGQTCTGCTEPSKNIQIDKKSCDASCPPNSAANDQKVCVCNEGYTPVADQNQCKETPSAGCAHDLTAAGCGTCTPDGQTCTGCTEPSKNIQIDKKSCDASCPPNSAANDQKVCVCNEGYTPVADQNQCKETPSAGCAHDLTAAGCGTCTPDGQTCTGCTEPSKNIQIDKKSCDASCPPNSAANDQKVCVCNEGYTPVADQNQCKETPSAGCAHDLTAAGCGTCTPDGQTCTGCTEPSKNIQIDKKSCDASCPPNSAANDQKVCVCNEGYTPVADQNQCKETPSAGCAHDLTAAGCGTCTPDGQTCTGCTEPSKNIQIDKKSCDASCPPNSAANDQKVCVCNEGYTPVADQNQCKETPSAGCAHDLTAAGCGTCTPDGQTCTGCTEPSKNIQIDKKSCDASCPPNSAANDQKVCVCNEGYTPVADQNQCKETPSAGCAHDLTAAGCGTCTPDGQTCTGCTEPSKNIQIDKKSCDASCPPNSAANDQKVCVCNEGYTPVADQNQCKETPSAGCAHDLTAAGCGTCTPDGQTCTGCTEPSKNIQIDKKSCDASCPPNSAANDQKVCVCNEGYTPVADQNQCKETPSAGCAHDLTAAGCGTCTPDGQTCTGCTEPSKNIQIDKKSCDASCPPNSAANDQKVCVCNEGYTPVADQNQCKETPSAGCAHDLTAAGCGTCTPDGQTCTGCTEPSKNIQIDKKSCDASCPPNSAANDQKVCVCNEGYTPVADQNQCKETPSAGCSTPNCKACDNPKTDREVCTECNDNSYLTPTSQCVPDCTAIKGYYGDTDKKCKKCHDTCAECVGPANSQCSACPASKALTYSDSAYPDRGGTCGDACKTTEGSTGCKVCGSTIGETLYCSQCNNNNQAPLNGNCAANARTRFCTTMSDGACTKCAAGYFLKDGGCYQTDRQPGKQVCGTAGQGVCTKCANGLPADNGDCSSKKCHESCSTCNGINEASCLVCATGYYKENGSDSTAGPCKKCSEKIPGCKQCTSSSAGSVICLESEAGTGGNVNKSGLSTGAIAGIAVAVIIVVGGLVGFLCWWFLCRGKA